MLTEELLNMVELQGTKKRPLKQSKAADKKTKFDVRNIAEQKQVCSILFSTYAVGNFIS